MKRITYLFKVIRALSLGVAAGAVITSYFLSLILDVAIASINYIPLFLSVWVIYTVDHLIDASRIKVELHTFRHKFHLAHKRLLLGVVLFISAINIFWVVTLLKYDILVVGLVLSLFILIYLIIAQNDRVRVELPVFKELFTSIGYTAGVLLLPLLLGESFDFKLLVICTVIIFLIAFSNLLTFSYFEYEIDIKQKQKSSVNYWGKRKIRYLITFLFIITISLIVFFFTYTDEFYYSLILFSMTITLFLQLLREEYFYKKERYRIWGDGIFLFPSIILLFDFLSY